MWCGVFEQNTKHFSHLQAFSIFQNNVSSDFLQWSMQYVPTMHDNLFSLHGIAYTQYAN